LESDTGRRIGSLPLDLAYLTGRKPTFRCGQIVYGYLRPYLNKVWIAEFDGCSSVDQFAYDVRNDMADVRFVAWFMRSPTYLRRSAVVTTTGQLPRIGTDQIAAVEIGLPPLDQQQAIADEIDSRFASLHRVKGLLHEETDTIEKMPAALLRQAFKGEL
jgi:type I restriction enzyme S subunit